MDLIFTCDINADAFTNTEIYPGVKVFTDVEEIDFSTVDTVFVCLPNRDAPISTLRALTNNCHVFCEKPAARKLIELKEIREHLLRNSQQVLMFGFNHRYHDSVISAKKLIESGDLGRPINFRGVYGKGKMINFSSNNWRTSLEAAGGGILLDQGIHMIDLLRHLIGEFDLVEAFIDNHYWKFDVEDNAFALLKNSDTGCTGTVHSTATQWQHKFRLEISLERGLITLSGILSGTKSYGQESISIFRRHDSNQGSGEENVTRFIDDYSWVREIDAFYNAITRGTKNYPNDLKEAILTQSLIETIYEKSGFYKNS